MGDKVIGSIYETIEYDKFKFLNWNRDIDTNHLERLIKSMKNGIFLDPILVSSDFVVLDGQHRLTACKQLNFPVRYILSNTDNIEDMKLVIVKNTFLSKWETADFINAYAESGFKEYVKIVNFMNEFKEFRLTRTVVQLLRLNFGRENRLSKNSIIDGTFKVKDLNKSRAIALKMLDIRMLRAFTMNKLDLCKNYRLFNAIAKLMFNDYYDHDRLKDKLVKYPTRLYPCITQEEYRNMIIDTYNYNQPRHTKLII